MIVQNGQKQTVNDDAHYLTFNSKGVYESDKNGYSVGQALISFIKNDKNIHCYCGRGYHGYAEYYFSADFSRLNVKLNNSITYVYQRTNGSTNAPLRQYNTGQQQTDVNMPIYSAPAQNGSTTPSRKPHRETCTMCGGSGQGTNHIKYTPDYTGHDTQVWCPECGKYASRHYHEKSRCGKCGGKGWVERYY